jgi:hypothetical protein
MRGSQLEERIARRVADLVLADLRPLLGTTDLLREAWKSEDPTKTPAPASGDAALCAKASAFGARWHRRHKKLDGSPSCASKKSNENR